MRRVKGLVAVAVPVLWVFAAACGGDEAEVNVTLSEFIVEPDPATVDAGEVTFVADNQGSETHEFLVVEAASADELPVDDEGAFDEGAFEEDALLGEVEDVTAGSEQELTLDLEAGTYVLLCNIVEEED